MRQAGRVPLSGRIGGGGYAVPALTKGTTSGAVGDTRPLTSLTGVGTAAERVVLYR